MNSEQSLIAELEDAIQGGSKDKRVDTLRRVTDLFLSDTDRLNEQQITVFDDVLGHLIKRVEGKALAELSRRLGPVRNAPVEVVRRLARDDNISVAEPILTQSTRLSDGDLIEIANTKTQAHLLAISGRSHLETGVTDVLLRRGDRHVFHRLADNSGARFSDQGFSTLVKHSEKDAQLAEKVGLRLDVPLQLFRQLLQRATEAVRARLLAMAGPESREQIQRVLANISDDVGCEASIQHKHDYAKARRFVLEMKSRGELTEPQLLEFAETNRRPEMIAALSLLCDAPLELVDNLMESEHREAFLIPCKAAGIAWPTVNAILNSRSAGHTLSDHDLDHARADYFKLTRSSAQRVLRFWLVRQTTTAGAAPSSNATPDTMRGSSPRILAG
jgi:uncharacterized protein (DUF2336 family)